MARSWSRSSRSPSSSPGASRSAQTPRTSDRGPGEPGQGALLRPVDPDRGAADPPAPRSRVPDRPARLDRARSRRRRAPGRLRLLQPGLLRGARAAPRRRVPGGDSRSRPISASPLDSRRLDSFGAWGNDPDARFANDGVDGRQDARPGKTALDSTARPGGGRAAEGLYPVTPTLIPASGRGRRSPR